MLTPNKHTNIKYSIPYIAGLIFREITRSGIIQYDDLQKVILSSTSKEIGDSFEYSLSYLFLINKIDYNQELDSFSIL